MIKRYYNAIGIDAGGTPNTYYDTNTNQAGNAVYDEHQANLVGVAGATLTIKVTQYSNGNHNGRLLINNVLVFLNFTFNIVLDGGGLGHYLVHVDGDAGQTGTGIIAKCTIIGMSAGFPSSPISNLISKVF